LRKDGLRLRLGEDEHHLAGIEVFSSIQEALVAGPFDLACFALKSYDTAAALAALKPHVADLPPFLCLQNGVDNEPALAAVLGPERVIAGTVTSSVSKSGPGRVALERLRGIGLAADHSLSERLADAMDAAGLRPRLYARPLEMKWSKLLTNLLANASCAILDLTPAEVFDHPGLFRLEMLQLREAIKVTRALHLDVVDLPGTPVRALAFAAGSLNPALARPLMARAVGRGRGAKMPSLHIDLHSGRKQSEVGWLNGAVVRHGRGLGLETPVNQLLHGTLSDIVSQGTNPCQHDPEALLARLQSS
jgi:2-dehydropantoate 2-reductase